VQETHEQTDVADPDLKKRKLSKEALCTSIDAAHHVVLSARKKNKLHLL
jgi:hypothetical protein